MKNNVLILKNSNDIIKAKVSVFSKVNTFYLFNGE